NAFGTTWLPEVAIGADDFIGTRLFSSEFIAANKRFDLDWGYVDGTVGYGRKRIDGLFGGARLGLKALPSWSLVAEYDRTDYNYGGHYAQTGETARSTGAWGGALEYRYGPLAFQVGRMHGQNV